MSYSYGNKFHYGKGPWRQRKLTCRTCGREPERCWYCNSPTCPSCTTSMGRCSHCGRPPRAITNGLPERILVVLEGRDYGMSEPQLARWFGVPVREIRRAVKKISDKVGSGRSGFFNRGVRYFFVRRKE